MLARSHPTSFDARAKKKDYRVHAAVPRPRFRLLGRVATSAGLILLVVGLVQV